MQRMKVLALCVAVLLTFSGLVSAKQGFDIKASVLFGTKLDVDDVGNIGAEGTGKMKWQYDSETPLDPLEGQKGHLRGDYGNFDLVLSGEKDEGAKNIAVSPEEEGYPILLEATYGMDKFQIGGFWLGGFKSEGEVSGEIKGIEQGKYHDFEQFIFYPLFGTEGFDVLTGLDAIVFFGGEDIPVLPGMDYEYRCWFGEEDGTTRTGTAGNLFGGNGLLGYNTAKGTDAICKEKLVVDPDLGASVWNTDVSFNLSNYGANVGYKLFDENNISVALVAGLEQLKWAEEVKSTATEKYNIRFTSMDVEYDVYDSTVWDSGEPGGYSDLLNDLDITQEGWAKLVTNGLATGEGTETNAYDLAENVYLMNFALDQYSQLLVNRDIKLVRELDYSPTGYSIGASLGALAADKLRVRAAFSLGWFSGDATVKLSAEDSRSASFETNRKGTAVFGKFGENDSVNYEVVDIADDADCWANQEDFKDLEDGLNNMTPNKSALPDKKHTDIEVTLTRAQVSAEYDVTDSVFLGGGFFYSQWKDMPVLSDTDALGIKTQDLVASGVNVEVGVRF